MSFFKKNGAALAEAEEGGLNLALLSVMSTS